MIIKKQLTRVLLWTTVILIFGGACVTPRYYSHDQKINIDTPLAKNAVIKVEDKEFNPQNISIPRARSSKTMIITQPDFEPYSIELKSSITSEKWANGPSSYTSAVFLLLPSNTVITLSETFSNPGMLLALPPMILVDVYNIAIGAASTAIKNPWFKYQYNTGALVFQPKEEALKLCHKNKNNFMSNQGCLPCSSALGAISLPEECARCSNRIYINYNKECWQKRK